MRLGDLDALKEALKEIFEVNEIEVVLLEDVFSIIDNAPTVEPENIKPIANVKVEISEEEKQRIIEQLRGKRQTLIRLELERTQGEWIGIDEFPHEDYECNYCGHSLFAVDISEYNYCPNCGASMLKGGASNEKNS